MNDTATPASTSRSALVAAANCDTPSTINVAPSAPANAIKGTVSSPRKRLVCNNARIAPNAPPADIPSRCGSASEFRVTACKLAPTIARPAPTRHARIARGNRISQTIAARPWDQSCSIVPGAILLIKMPQTVSSGTAIAPTLTATDNDATRATHPKTPAAQRPRYIRGRCRVACCVMSAIYCARNAAARVLTAAMLRGPGVASTYSSTTKRLLRTASISANAGFDVKNAIF